MAQMDLEWTNSWLTFLALDTIFTDNYNLVFGLTFYVCICQQYPIDNSTIMVVMGQAAKVFETIIIITITITITIIVVVVIIIITII